MKFIAMFTLQRIFWKIFLFFGLTNLTLVAIGTYTVLHTQQSENFKRKQIEFVRDISEVIIYRLESGKSVNQGRIFKSISQENPRYRRWMDRHTISIYDESASTVVFTSRQTKKEEGSFKINVPFESIGGKKYLIQTSTEPPRIDVIQSLSRVNKLQYVLLLVFSAMLSFLLSWSISSPLKKLGAFGRSYTGKSNDREIDPKLLSRGDEIGDLSRDFKAMRQEVEKTISNQQQLLHDVSHELRAPLARLQTTAGLMEQSLSSENTHLNRIHLECDNINGLIQQILNFSRIEQADTRVSVVDLHELLRSEVDAITYQYPEREIRFVEQEKSITMNVDSELLSHALANILQNACKHTEASLPVDVSLTETLEAIHIDVRDYGEGVKNSELHTLMTPFYRANNKMHAEGFGLGLSIAKRSMAKNNGDIQIKNHPEGGLLVSLILYLSAANQI